MKAALDLQEVAIVDVLRGDMERSTFLGVILTEHIDRRDLLPRRGQPRLADDINSVAAVEGLLQQIRDVSKRPAAVPGTPRVQSPQATVRVHPDVREGLMERSRRAGLSLRQYSAAVIRERLGIEPRAGRAEALPLAM